MENMARFFVISRDPLYRKGKIAGKLEAQRERELANARKYVQNLLNDGSFSMEKICQLVEVPMEIVIIIKKELEAKKRRKKTDDQAVL